MTQTPRAPNGKTLASGAATFSSAPPGLPRRALGRTGIVAPILGFGVSGALSTPLTSDALTTTLINDARAGGVELFDTAPFYGGGRAEHRLGLAFEHSAPSTALISTKGGTRQIGRRYIKDFSQDGLLAQLTESRERLGKVDLFFLHGPAPAFLTRELLDFLIGLKTKGLFRYLGIAGRGEELDVAVDSHAFDVVMAPAHKLSPPVHLDRLERARASGLGVIGIECLAPAARGARISLRPADLWYSARALARLLRGDTKPPQHAGLSAADCLTWTLRSGLVDIALTTTTRIEHLQDSLETARQCGP